MTVLEEMVLICHCPLKLGTLLRKLAKSYQHLSTEASKQSLAMTETADKELENIGFHYFENYKTTLLVKRLPGSFDKIVLHNKNARIASYSYIQIIKFQAIYSYECI